MIATIIPLRRSWSSIYLFVYFYIRLIMMDFCFMVLAVFSSYLAWWWWFFNFFLFNGCLLIRYGSKSLLFSPWLTGIYWWIMPLMQIPWSSIAEISWVSDFREDSLWIKRIWPLTLSEIAITVVALISAFPSAFSVGPYFPSVLFTSPVVSWGQTSLLCPSRSQL